MNKRKQTANNQPSSPTMKPTMSIPFIYLRISPKEKTREGFNLGIDVQRRKSIAMASLKDWNVLEDDIFIDDNKTGAEGPNKRPALKRMLDRCVAEPGHPVIVAALDRLSRDRELTYALTDIITKEGKGAFLSCNETIDTTTAMGRFSFGMYVLMGTLERERLIERTTEALAILKDSGMQCGKLPYGFMRGQEHKINQGGEIVSRYEIIPNPDELKILQIIYSMADEGIRNADIARFLNDNGYPTRGSRKKGTEGSGIWLKCRIGKILKNRPAPNDRSFESNDLSCDTDNNLSSTEVVHDTEIASA